MKQPADKFTPVCLVIGYGNTLRRDDGVGVEAAQAIAAMNLPGVDVITRHQLVPELAEPISRAGAVIFVDAHAAATGGPELHSVEPAQSSQILAHAADPRSLLALAKQVFGANPKAWTLAIPVEDLNFGFGLSRRSQDGLRVAVRLIEQTIAGLTNSAYRSAI